MQIFNHSYTRDDNDPNLAAAIAADSAGLPEGIRIVSSLWRHRCSAYGNFSFRHFFVIGPRYAVELTAKDGSPDTKASQLKETEARAELLIHVKRADDIVLPEGVVKITSDILKE